MALALAHNVAPEALTTLLALGVPLTLGEPLTAPLPVLATVALKMRDGAALALAEGDREFDALPRAERDSELHGDEVFETAGEALGPGEPLTVLLCALEGDARAEEDALAVDRMLKEPLAVFAALARALAEGAENVAVLDIAADADAAAGELLPVMEGNRVALGDLEELADFSGDLDIGGEAESLALILEERDTDADPVNELLERALREIDAVARALSLRASE